MLKTGLQHVQQIIDTYGINVVNLIFVGFIAIIVIFGSLMRFVEHKLPICIRQTFRYGKHSLKGVNDPLVSRLEVPKCWFKHFYVFAFSWSLFALYLQLKALILRTEAPEYVLAFLDLVAGGRRNRRVQVDSTRALIACVLITMQCVRRYYETNFVQIFSKKSKINFSQYMVGYLHYFGAVVAVLANTEGFVRGTLPTSFSYSKITLLEYACTFVFHFSWAQQYKANMILVNLRKDTNTGKVNTESHLLPRGGYFELLSSPHMTFEVLMYVSLWGILLRSTTWYLIVIWVFGNQLVNALLTHEWYQQTFKNYPKDRCAFMPHIL